VSQALAAYLAPRLQGWAARRPPDQVIGEDYLTRWYVIPRNPVANVYLHRFTRSDDDRACHDHPWLSVSLCLSGRMIEVLPDEDFRWVEPGTVVFRRARHAHRLELVKGPVWTLFLTGPVVRSWYFHCPQGLVHWREFSDESGNRIGRGCD